MLDAVVISDLHLGSSVCQAKNIFSFLSQLPETRRLILNGDVLEDISVHFTKVEWTILSQLRYLSKKTPVIWIKGNHDSDAQSVANLINAEYLGQYSFVSGKKRLLCSHGDTWDEFANEKPFLTSFSTMVYKGLKTVSKPLAIFAEKKWNSYMENFDKVSDGAIQHAKDRGFDAVLCGHTHLAGIIEQCYNSGSWVGGKNHYLTVDNGLIILKEFENV